MSTIIKALSINTWLVISWTDFLVLLAAQDIAAITGISQSLSKATCSPWPMFWPM
jgi:hypothetical protein